MTSHGDLRRALLVGLVAELGPIRQGELLRTAGLSPRDRTGRRALADAVTAGLLARDGAGPYRLASSTDVTRSGPPAPKFDRQAWLADNVRAVERIRKLTTDPATRKDPR